MNGKGFNWFYPLIGLLFVAMLYVNSSFFKGSSGMMVGITRAKEHKIIAEKSSLVKAVHVVPGKQVKKGDLLLELTSDALEIDITKLKNKIALMATEADDRDHLLESEIAYVKAQTAIEINEIDTDIEEIRSELELNRSLNRELKISSSDSVINPSLQRIAALETQKTRLTRAMELKIEDLKQRSRTSGKQEDNQLALLRQELTLLELERGKLSKYSSQDGVVESVYVKEGEQVEAYTPLLSVDPVRPANVVGYLSGRKMHLKIGDSVLVSSYGSKSGAVEGSVIGFGAVAALPDILQKSTAERAFGQEVFIEITDANAFAIGEKVLIK